MYLYICLLFGLILSEKLEFLENDCYRDRCICMDYVGRDLSIADSHCSNNASNDCFKSSVCSRDEQHRCGWAYDKNLKECLVKENYCRVVGCHGGHCERNIGEVPQIACDKSFRIGDKCYPKFGKCEVLSNGDCDWHHSPELDNCLSGGN